MPEDYAELEVAVIQWVDNEPQPGIIEFEFSDRFGRQWHFREKQALVSETWLGTGDVYPQIGRLRCQVLSRSRDSEGRLIAEIDTSQPWGVESLEEISRFDRLSREGQARQDTLQE